MEQRVPITIKQDEARTAMALEGVVDISVATELKQSLLEALGSGKELHVSLAAVTELDVTAVQLLWAAAREASAQGVAFVLDEPPPPAAARSLANSGLEELLPPAQDR